MGAHKSVRVDLSCLAGWSFAAAWEVVEADIHKFIVINQPLCICNHPSNFFYPGFILYLHWLGFT